LHLGIFEQPMKIDPFGGAKPRLLRQGKEVPLRVNPEQAQAFGPGSRRVDFFSNLLILLELGNKVQYAF